MTDRTFASLVPRVAASVHGCPQPTIIQYIRDAAIRTCERTLLWRYQIPLFNLQAGVSEYAYNVPSGTKVHALFEMIVNSRPLDRLTLDDALRLYPEWADLYSGESAATAWSLTPTASTWNTPAFDEAEFNESTPYVVPSAIVADASTPRAVCQITPDKFVVLPLPDDQATYQTRMFVALKPTRTATGMDEVVFDDLEEVIMHGALQHLLLIPSMTWTDKELASYHAKQYAFQIGERRARANLGNMRGTMSVRMQSFGA